MAEKISFKAKIEYVVYFKDTFGVVSVSTTEDIPFSKMKEDYDIETNTISVKYLTTITGKMQEPKIGQTWDVVAHHVFNQKYKKDQYQIDSINFAIPTTVADTKGYLESILTQNQADTLLAAYPNIVQDVIDGKENVDLNLLKGFGEKTWEKTKDKIIENFASADILSILIPLDISFKKIQKLLEFEGGDTQSLTKYEGEVIAFSKEYYKDDPMYDMYASGASPKWDVDFKSLKISLGVTPVPGSSEVAMITSNLKDGIKNEEIFNQILQSIDIEKRRYFLCL